jgi:hypothetical protein
VTAVPAPRHGLVPPPRRITAAQHMVERRLAQLEVEAAGLGLMLEQIAGIRWWQGRSWKWWTPVGAGGVLAFGGCLVAAVSVLKALIAALVLIATLMLGAAIVIALIAGLGSAGGKTFSGTFSGRMH